MPNVQLSEGEAVRVFIDMDTGRILGMTPAAIKAPLVSHGVRWRCEILNHAYEIESYLKRWREQVRLEALFRTERQAQRDAIFRNALASQVRARNQNVDQWNRDENNRLLAKMDADYDRKLKVQMNPQLVGVAEGSEVSKSSLDVALDSPYFKHGPEPVAQGGAVDPEAK